MHLSASVYPSAEPMATCSIVFPKEEASESTLPEASCPASEHNIIGTEALESFSTISLRLTLQYSLHWKASPNTEET